MVHPRLDYFGADLTIYPGNSGGPVVSDGALVGIVSGQGVVELERAEGGEEQAERVELVARVPLARAMKAELVEDLFEAQLAMLSERRPYPTE
jgi:S1-C subfamily serine protease